MVIQITDKKLTLTVGLGARVDKELVSTSMVGAILEIVVNG